ncbi:hypothetical protein ABK040_005583 [Willaertia magna]
MNHPIGNTSDRFVADDVTNTKQEEDDNAEEEEEQDNLVRSQRLSDTYPIRIELTKKSKNSLTNTYQSFLSSFLIQPFIHFLFPRVLNNKISFFFVPTTTIKLLCTWTCPYGHICKYDEGHEGPHECIFGHKELEYNKKKNTTINKDYESDICGHLCDCRYCESPCSLSKGHSGTHKCYFKHSLRDIPINRKQQELFRDEKAISDYTSELAFIQHEDELKYSSIPMNRNEKDENWTEN